MTRAEQSNREGERVMYDAAGLFVGIVIGVVLTVIWWMHSKVRLWWENFERTRLRIEADGKRIEEYLASKAATMSDDRVELKPCPFCGENGEQFERGFTDDKADNGNAYIGCDHCGIEQPYYSTPADAIAAWNTRTLDPSIESLQAEVERYRQALVLLSSSFETGWASRLNDRAAVIGRVKGIARQALEAKEQTHDR